MPSLLDLNLLFRRNAPSAESGNVDVGDRFYKPGQRNQIWIVERVFQPAGNALAHVVLKRGGDNPETYVISVMALMNPHMFRRDRRDPDAMNVRGHSRRSMDYVKEPLLAEKPSKAEDPQEDEKSSLGGVSS